MILQRNQDFPEEEVHYLGNSAWCFFYSNMTESSGTAVSSLNKTFSVYHCVPSCRNSFIGIVISNWGRVIHYSMFKMRKINNGYTSFYPPRPYFWMQGQRSCQLPTFNNFCVQQSKYSVAPTFCGPSRIGCLFALPFTIIADSSHHFTPSEFT